MRFFYPTIAGNCSQQADASQVEVIQKRLNDTHGNRFSAAEYFLWAETIVSWIVGKEMFENVYF